MVIFLLSTLILSCKIVSLVCLIISVRSYQWFRVENYAVNRENIKDLCVSYGAFCNREDQMPLPRLIVILPCALSALSLSLELLNLILLYSVWQRVRSILNFCLEQTSIALSCAITIHCFWVTAVYLRISLEMSIVHLHWTFFAFGLGTILMPLDGLCSISRMINNCQYEKIRQGPQTLPLFTYGHKPIC